VKIVVSIAALGSRAFQRTAIFTTPERAGKNG